MMILASFAVNRVVMPFSSRRSRFDLPDSGPPIATKCGSVIVSSHTGASSISSMANGILRSAGSWTIAGSAAWSRFSGSSRTSAARGPFQAWLTAAMKPRWPAATSTASSTESIRGRPMSVCRPPRVRPRPGRPVGTIAWILRSISESNGSPSFSSILDCSASFVAARISDHFAAPIHRWMPKPRPPFASAWICGSRASNSVLRVAQPSMTRKMSVGNRSAGMLPSRRPCR